MKEYVLDANAVLRYFGVSEGQGTHKVRALFGQAERGQARLSMSVINLGEVLYVLLKHVGESRARHYVRVLQHVVTMVEADTAQALGAAEMKHECRLRAYRGQLCGYAGIDVESDARIRRSGIRKAGQDA